MDKHGAGRIGIIKRSNISVNPFAGILKFKKTGSGNATETSLSFQF